MIKVEENKLPQHDFPSEVFFNPKVLYLPLNQHVGKPSQEVVKKGDFVEEADLIAEPKGVISSSLHAPNRGKVKDIDYLIHPILGRMRSIIIECDEYIRSYHERKNADYFDRTKLLEIIKSSGIVGMGGACFPTHIKLTPPKKIDTLIINGCECEPYLTCDFRLMVENTRAILKGVEVICKILEPKNVFFCIEDNKSEAIKKINDELSSKKYNLPNSKVVVLKSRYPQGGEKQLIYSVTRRKVPSGGLPFEVGCLVHNVATCFAIYEAVYFDKPLISRLVTFAGDSLTTPKNIWVKIGTTVKELVDRGVIGFKKEPKKVIFGGPMMGVSLRGLDFPILKGTSGVLFFSSDSLKDDIERTCIKCARCVDVCPMNLLPLEFVRKVKNEEFKRLSEFFIEDCIECGCCAFVCPAKIPIVHYIKVGKKYVLNSK